MTGKDTSGKGVHETRKGRIVEDISITASDWTRLETTLERSIAPVERISITEALSMFASMREEYESDHVSAQDVKATLKKISELPDKEIHRAVSHCDTWTEERLMHALWRMGEKEKWSGSDHPPAKWKAVAMLAHAEFPNRAGGPREKWYRAPLARYAFALWKTMGRTDNGVWGLEGDASPVVVFATCLFALIETDTVAGPPSYSTVAKLLRKVTS